ncbi:putative secreted protein [Mycobacteroides abscessus subsp. abscessus]|nr:putative secreted protein [Mycobacteroides abscessus subsp. abscessus]
MSLHLGTPLATGAAVVTFASAMFAAPAAHADQEHTVRYVVTAEASQEVSIYYREAPQTVNWSGVHIENDVVVPGTPWEQTVHLADPATAYVAVRNVWWNPNMHCEIWIDGTKAMESSPNGVCIPRPQVSD